jgi:7-carboxy-7-deazaguanine synthase
MPQSDSVHLDEIFYSLQGEAGEIGRPHLFLRLGGCPLRCVYCDTPRSWTQRAEYERHLGAVTTRGANPLGMDALDAELAAVCAHHGVAPARTTLAVTGGEPLAQADFLAAWLPRWPGRVLLETAGLWPERLQALREAVDVISLDWKLASTLRSGGELADPRGCLAAAAGARRARFWVKLVVSAECADGVVDAALAEIARIAPAAAVFLQPVTPVARGPRPPDAERLLHWTVRGGALGLDLRAVPQVHPLLGAR